MLHDERESCGYPKLGEQYRNADRSEYLDQYTIEVPSPTPINVQNQMPIIGPSSATSKLESMIAASA
jgi:hypothetical protein